MRKKQLTSSLLLVLAALIWGSAFVAQRVGLDYAGALTFNGARCLIGTLVLIPVSLIFRPAPDYSRKRTVAGGVLCGLCLFAATNLQQMGLAYTEVGKAGFITTFYIVLVPVLGMLVGKKTGLLNWVAILFALGGLYFLCMNGGGFSVRKGEIMELSCALFYSLQIMVIDRCVKDADGVRLSCIQFAVCGILSIISAFLFEEPNLRTLWQGWIPLLYAGVLSCGVAYTLQIVGQKHLHPTTASLLMSLESAFAVLAGWVVLREKLSGREFLGCGLMLVAVILAQIAPTKE